jgi:hypothetical protein
MRRFAFPVSKVDPALGVAEKGYEPMIDDVRENWDLCRFYFAS